MPNDATNPPGTSQFQPLTFDAAAATGAAACARCGVPLRGSYHMIGESMACGKCRYAVEEQLQSGTGAAGLLRAMLFGGGAAIVGAIAYYAFVKLTDHEWALITALVGIGVGMAVRMGSRGHGGRKFQIVAIVLTWLAMGGSHLPFLLEGAREAKRPSTAAPASNVPDAASQRGHADSTAALQSASVDDDDARALPQATGDSTAVSPTASLGEPVYMEESHGTAFAALAVVLLIGLFATPVIVAIASPIAGLCTAYALYRAWKTNAGGPRLETSGPFQLKGGATDAGVV